MKTYEKYKPSGIEWIGDIPEHWEIKKLKYLAEIETGGTPTKADEDNYDENGLAWIKPDNLDEFNPICDSKERISAKGLKGMKIIPKGSVLLCGIGSIGKFGIAKENLVTNQQINSVIFGENLNSEFGKYIIFSSKEELVKNSNKVVVAILNKTSQQNIEYPLPTLLEQTAIADYLDEKTAEIDKLIANKQRLIELLKEERTAIINKAVTCGINADAKLTPSGIDWLGDIPEHWEVKRLKYLVKIFGRIGFRGYTVADIVQPKQGAISLSPSNIVSNELSLEVLTYISWEKYYESPEIQIFEDDIVFVKTGSTIGKIAVIPKLDEHLTINPQMVVFKQININRKYLYYNFFLPNVNAEISISKIGGATPAISQEKLNNLWIIQPPIEEQKEIVEFIESKTNEIDSTVSKIEKEIELIKEYRTALISEVVTGKIKVI